MQLKMMQCVCQAWCGATSLLPVLKKQDLATLASQRTEKKIAGDKIVWINDSAALFLIVICSLLWSEKIRGLQADHCISKKDSFFGVNLRSDYLGV